MILFGLSNIPVSFQNYVNKILSEKLDIFLIVYLNNIFIYNENLRKIYVNTIYWVLDELQKHGFFANLKKNRFY